ncbi:MAG: CopG family ribbon-helix-helix protein, partial [Beijerinckiaceae bacterium]
MDPQVRERLETAAREEDRSADSVAQRAITEFLDRRDAFQRELDTSLAEADRDELIDGDAVHTWIESWGTGNQLPEPTWATNPFKG